MPVARSITAALLRFNKEVHSLLGVLASAIASAAAPVKCGVKPVTSTVALVSVAAVLPVNPPPIDHRLMGCATMTSTEWTW